MFDVFGAGSARGTGAAPRTMSEPMSDAAMPKDLSMGSLVEVTSMRQFADVPTAPDPCRGRVEFVVRQHAMRVAKQLGVARCVSPPRCSNQTRGRLAATDRPTPASRRIAPYTAHFMWPVMKLPGRTLIPCRIQITPTTQHRTPATNNGIRIGPPG